MGIGWIVFMIVIAVPFAFAVGFLIGSQRNNSHSTYDINRLAWLIEEDRRQEAQRGNGCASILFLLILALLAYLAFGLV